MTVDAATMPLRPALGVVLGELTGMPAASWDAWPADDVRVTRWAAGVRLAGFPRLEFAMGPVPWVEPSVPAAWERLQARGLVPDGRWRFACADCLGVGLVAALAAPRVACPCCALPCAPCGGRGRGRGRVGRGRVGRVGGDAGPVCDDCGGDGLDRAEVSPGFVEVPRTIPALVSWASLGFAPVVDAAGDLVAPGVPGAEELAARELVTGVVSWRVFRLQGAHRPGDAPGSLRAMGLCPLRGIDGVQVVVPPIGGWS